MPHDMLLLGYLALINLIAFLAYGRDKRHARDGNWRISEGTLLLLALLGGSPASFVAQRLFRHKLRKFSFQLRFWLVVLIQIAGIGYFWDQISLFLGA